MPAFAEEISRHKPKEAALSPSSDSEQQHQQYSTQVCGGGSVRWVQYSTQVCGVDLLGGYTTAHRYVGLVC